MATKGRPKGYYYRGKRIPSVTTLLPEPSLAYWGGQQGARPAKYLSAGIRMALGLREQRLQVGTGSPQARRKSLDLEKQADAELRRVLTLHDEGYLADIYDARDEAAYAGKVVHSMIEAHLAGEEYEAEVPEEIADLVQQGWESFLHWKQRHDLDAIHLELPLICWVYAGLPEEDRPAWADEEDPLQWYGGTMDLVARVAGILAVIDWKTSKGIYPDYVIQAAAYAHAWNFGRPQYAEDLERFQQLRADLGPVARTELLRVGKEGGDFHHHSYDLGQMDLAMAQFRRYREIHTANLELRKLVR